MTISRTSRFLIFSLCAFLLLATGYEARYLYLRWRHRTTWQQRLYTPTELTKIGDLYFIVDCWHNRVLYQKTLDPDLSEWKVLDNDLAGPHSIASDSYFYVVEDTGRDRLKVYRRLGDEFNPVQTIDNVGLRPHFTVYDPATSAFYVIGANSQTITKLKREGDRLRVQYTKNLQFLDGVYTRSFTILDGDMYFVSGPRRIFKTRYTDDSYQVIASYKVPESLQSMNGLYRTEHYYYLTGTPRTIVRTESLEALEEGKYQDVYDELGLHGTPYYIVRFDGRYYLPEITEYSGIVSFVETEGRIDNVSKLFDFGEPKLADDQEKKRLPK
ncbi:MAG: hypothetical protein QOH63_1800 [Acidobacteriota bacterium]|nr:hypothetical protein [Acidobacteriota bacterium]